MTNQDGRPELVWPNIAKAACIVLVVVMHFGTRVSALPLAHHYPFADAWESINWFLRPMRMPLFFLVSGIMASNSILRPHALTERNRLTRPLYLYVVWGVIYRLLIPEGEGGAWADMSIFDHAYFVTALMSSSWYMAALGIFYLLTRATLRLPLAAVLTACAIVSLAATLLCPYFAGNPTNMMRCAFFFVAGVRMKARLLEWVEGLTARRTLALCAVYVVGALLCVKLKIFLLPVDALGVASGAGLCGLLARRLPALSSPARWLARRTLPIYLIHFLAMPVLASLTALWAAPLLGQVWAGFAYPVVGAGVLVLGSIAAHGVLMRAKAAWLFDLPGWVDALRTKPEAVPAAEPLKLAA